MSKLLVKPIGEFIEERTDRLKENKTTIYSVTNERGFVPSLDLFDKQVFSADTGNYKRVEFQDLAYNPSRINVGSVAMCEDKNGGAVSPMYCIVRCKAGLFPNYLLRFLKSEVGISQIRHRCEGAVRFQLKFRDLSAIPIYLPPLQEQERILKLLDEADELRKLRAQADQRTDALIPALFHKMLSCANFTEKTIGQLLEEGWLLLHKDGNHGSLYPRSGDFGIKGIPFLSATCVTDAGAIDHSEVKRLAEAKAKLLRHGWIERDDVLLAHNASVGAVGFYDGDYDRAIIGTSLTAFRVNPDKIEARFFWALLRDDFFQSQLARIMKQALRNQVPITAQRELVLRIPDLTLQKEFAQRATEIRELEMAQASSRQRLDDLFNSMLYRAFNGEL